MRISIEIFVWPGKNLAEWFFKSYNYDNIIALKIFHGKHPSHIPFKPLYMVRFVFTHIANSLIFLTLTPHMQHAGDCPVSAIVRLMIPMKYFKKLFRCFNTFTSLLCRDFTLVIHLSTIDLSVEWKQNS